MAITFLECQISKPDEFSSGLSISTKGDVNYTGALPERLLPGISQQNLPGCITALNLRQNTCLPGIARLSREQGTSHESLTGIITSECADCSSLLECPGLLGFVVGNKVRPCKLFTIKDHNLTLELKSRRLEIPMPDCAECLKTGKLGKDGDVKVIGWSRKLTDCILPHRLKSVLIPQLK